MKTAQIYLVSFIITASLTLGLIAYGSNKPDPTTDAIETAISIRRVDPNASLVRYYREVNEKELAWFMTWHESDSLLYDNGEYIVFYNDTAKESDYVWIYKVN